MMKSQLLNVTAAVIAVALTGCASHPGGQQSSAPKMSCIETTTEQQPLLDAALAMSQGTVSPVAGNELFNDQVTCLQSQHFDPGAWVKSVLSQLEALPLEQQQAVVAKYAPESAALLSPAPKGLIGATLKKEDGGVRVESVLAGGPADQANLRAGDLILGVSADDEAAPVAVASMTLTEVIGLITGEPGTSLALVVLPEQALETRRLSLTRAEISLQQFAEQRRQEQQQQLVRQDNQGQYLSPYTRDGVVAEWVNRAINANMGSAAGSAVGAAAGSYAANRALGSVPFGGLLGGMAGSRAGAAIGRDQAIAHSGGEAFMRQTSDLSFDSLQNMAVWLQQEHGQSGNFADVIKAANHVYPGLSAAVAGGR